MYLGISGPFSYHGVFSIWLFGPWSWTLWNIVLPVFLSSLGSFLSFYFLDNHQVWLLTYCLASPWLTVFTFGYFRSFVTIFFLNICRMLNNCKLILVPWHHKCQLVEIFLNCNYMLQCYIRNTIHWSPTKFQDVCPEIEWIFEYLLSTRSDLNIH